ncbi:MAG: hypothetical protein Q9185_005400 [Variospora sp. 1 TL-2023]
MASPHSHQALDACCTQADQLSRKEESRPEAVLEIATTPPQPTNHYPEGQGSPQSNVNKNLKRPREENGQEGSTCPDVEQTSPPTAKRARSGPDSVPFWGLDAIKPLTEANLDTFLESMSGSDQRYQPLSRKNSAQHRRVTALSSSKRSHAESESVSEGSCLSSRAVTATNPRFPKYLMDCGFDGEATEKPPAEDLEALRLVMRTTRDSPEPDHQLFHLTRKEMKFKNEVSVVKRLSPLLFPYRDLPTNNQKTSNLVYHDDVSWQEWGSNKPGFLPTSKPDLCIAFKSSAFTSQEAARMTSPYLLSTSYAPSLTLEVKTALQSMVIAERQNANNMISLLQRDFALQKDIGQHKQAERRIRFISTTHDTVLQRWQAWYFVIKDDGNPKWCCCDLGKVDYEDPDSDGFQTARRYNLNLCEYISDSVFKKFRKTLAGCGTDPSTHGPELQEEGITADVRSVHLSTPSASTTGDSESKRVKR